MSRYQSNVTNLYVDEDDPIEVDGYIAIRNRSEMIFCLVPNTAKSFEKACRIIDATTEYAITRKHKEKK